MWTGMRGLSPVPSYVIMQPTTLCNLDCRYCYLPQRSLDQRMPVAVARAVAATVNTWAAAAPRFSVVWHGGEPLAAGRSQLEALMAPFEGVEHHIQTNATLIDDAWCDLFVAQDVRVGLSIDGPTSAERVLRGGGPALSRIKRGIEHLRARGLPFAALAVVSQPSAALAESLYDFFLDLAPTILALNLEEREGVNTVGLRAAEADVRAFWAALTAAWRRDPRLAVREVEWALRFAAATLAGEADGLLPRRHDPIPTIAWDGSVTLLSPELAGHGFDSGHVLRTPLDEIVAGQAMTPDPWIGEFLTGVEACRTGCDSFGFCGGGHAANRWFEHGRLDGTQTSHCRNSRILLLEGVLNDRVLDDRVLDDRLRESPGLAELVAEAEAVWRARVDLDHNDGWGAFEDAFPTFWEFSNRPR